jgi:hypothetical protein
MIVLFVDIGGIVDHHRLNFLFIDVREYLRCNQRMDKPEKLAT